YRRIDSLTVELAVKHDLPLGDVPRKVGDRMGDIIVRHGQNRNLRDRTGSTAYNARALIEGGELAVQIAGVTLSGRNLSLAGGDLAHRLAEGGDICQNNQNVHALFESQVFGRGERHLRRDQTFHDRVIGQVQEHYHVVGYAALLKGTAEELRHVVFDAHRREDDGELLVCVASQ